MASPASAADLAAIQREIDALKSAVGTQLHLPSSSGAALQIPNFTGERNSSRDVTFDEFIERFRLVARAMGWTEKQRVALLPTYLSSYALELYRELTPAVQNDFKLLVNSTPN